MNRRNVVIGTVAVALAAFAGAVLLWAHAFGA